VTFKIIYFSTVDVAENMKKHAMALLMFTNVQTVHLKGALTTFIQVEVILIAELFRATSKEYIIFPKEVLKASDLANKEFVRKTPKVSWINVRIQLKTN